jgi:hypothetical protein
LAHDTRVYEDHIQTLTGKTIKLEENTMALRRGTIVTKVGSTTYCINSADTILDSSTTAPEDPIQTALDSGDNEIWLSDPSYTLSSGFSGLTITNSLRTIQGGSRFTKLIIPNGYSGEVLTTTDVSFCTIRSIRMDEAGTPAKAWTGLAMKSSSSTGLKHNRIEKLEINHAGVGISIECSTTGDAFINSNMFTDIHMYYPIIGMEWVHFAGANMSHNYYEYMDIQADSNTTHGFKDVGERSPVFINPTVQDMDPGAIQMSTDSTCVDLIIIGGTINSGGSTGLFTDNGIKTKGLVRGKGLMLTDSNIELGTTIGVKIGTSTTQKLGFFNGTPIVQESANADTSGATLRQLETEVNQLKQLLRNYGLLAT